MKNPHSALRTPHSRPPYDFMTAAAALAADWSGYHLSQKADGVCVRREWNGAAVWGDSLPDGRLMVWEIDTFRGQDIRACPWPERDAALSEVFRAILHPPSSILHPNAVPNWQRGPENRNGKAENRNFLAEMIRQAEANHTPDVAVAKPICSGFGLGLVKIKLIQTYDVMVTDADGASLSVAIAHEGRAAGRVSVRNLKVRDALRAGDCIEIAGTLLPGGKFREPRFLRTREDKAESR